MKTRLTAETYLIIIPMILLTIIGILAIASVSPRPGSLFEAESILSRATMAKVISYQPVKQLLFALIGFLLFLLILKWNYYSLRNYAYIFYFLLLLMIMAVMFMGISVYGSKRWIHMGPFAFQPSEYMKIIVVLVLAQYLMHKTNVARLTGMFIPFVLAMVPMALVLVQPDLGTAFVFLPILFVMIYVAGARVKYLLITVLIGLMCMPLAYFFLMKDYQKSRVQVFLNPSKSPTADGYHLLQSRIAVGTGGLAGASWGEEGDAPTVFVPAQHTDFIFTIIAEKWGFIGAGLVLLLYFMLIAAALFFAGTTREPYGRLIIVGITAYIITQVLVNISMTIGLAPITGITLPLLSYGGSSLTSTFIALGLIVNIRAKQIPTFSSRDF